MGETELKKRMTSIESKVVATCWIYKINHSYKFRKLCMK